MRDAGPAVKRMISASSSSAILRASSGVTVAGSGCRFAAAWRCGAASRAGDLPVAIRDARSRWYAWTAVAAVETCGQVHSASSLGP